MKFTATMNFGVSLDHYLRFIKKKPNSDQITFELWDENLFSLTNRQPESVINIAQLYWQGMNQICCFIQISTIQIQILSQRIQRKDSKASDIHGVICETTKHATSTVGTCKFDFPYGSPTYGTFSFKRNESEKESKIKCFQQVKPGLEVKNTFFVETISQNFFKCSIISLATLYLTIWLLSFRKFINKNSKRVLGAKDSRRKQCVIKDFIKVSWFSDVYLNQ